MLSKDMCLGIFLIFLAIAAYLATLSYPLDSAYFPRFIIVLLALLGVATVMKEILQREKSGGINQKEALPQGEKVAFWMIPKVKKVSGMILSSFVYMVVMNYVGFFVTTSVYLPIMMRLLGIRKLRTIFFSSFLVIFFIYLIFVAFLHVPFPEGVAV